MVASHKFSAVCSTVLTILLIAIGQLFREQLSASRPGTLIAGALGSLVFTFALTSISNYKMTLASPAAKSGLFDAFLALALAAVTTVFIHRVAITICVIFSGCLLFILDVVAQSHYGHRPQGVVVAEKKTKRN